MQIYQILFQELESLNLLIIASLNLKKFEEGNSKYIIARKAAYFWLAVFQGGVYYIIDTLYLVMLLSGTLFTYYNKITVVDFCNIYAIC